MTDRDSSPPDSLPDLPRSDAAGVRDASAAPSEETAAFPWPPATGESVLDAWGRTWSGAALSPRQFFQSLPRTGSVGAAVFYYLSIGIPVAGAQLFWTMLWGVDDTAQAAVTAGLGEWGPLIDFLLSPVFLLIKLFLAAGVVHLLLRMFGGTNGDFGLTVRVFSFAYSPQILGIVPVVGSFAGFIWMVIVAVIGTREAHRTTTGRAAAAILIPLSIALFFVLLAELIVRAGGLLDLQV